jgi:predicted nucleic acid-binding protein
LIVLDASTAIDWLFEQTPASASLDAALRDAPVIVPSHWPLEIANTLRSDLRDRKVSIADFHAIIDRLDALDFRIEQPIDVHEIGPLSQFAVTHDLTACDAAYVQLALQQQGILATLDRAMRKAAAFMNIPLLPATAG